MALTILTEAPEGTSKVITMTFANEAGSSVVPISCEWDLRTNAGEIVNSRASVATVVATAITITLQSADMAWAANVSTSRILTVRAVYSSIYGSAQTVAEEAEFDIRNLAGV